MYREYLDFSDSSINTNSDCFLSIIILYKALFSLFLPFLCKAWIINTVWIYKLNVLLGMTGGRAFHPKERANKANMQHSPKVKATHRGSCDIFMTEEKNPRSVTLSSLCMCTTFRPAAGLPSSNECRHDAGQGGMFLAVCWVRESKEDEKLKNR